MQVSKINSIQVEFKVQEMGKLRKLVVLVLSIRILEQLLRLKLKIYKKV